MVMPFSGTISLSRANVELNKSATATISLGDTAVRKLAGKTSGTISMSDLYGKAFEIKYTNSTNRTAANIHTLMGSPTAVGDYIFENNATISAASRGGWALQTGAFPAGSTLTIINRGGIRGGGGDGGNGNNGGANKRPGLAGGSALVLNFPATIDNTSGTIWGGGGGGSGYLWADAEGGDTGGGGGAGMPAGAGGTGDGDSGHAGKAGSATAGGAAGGTGTNRKAGNGGAPGNAGQTSSAAGGRGGYSVQRNGHAVTWIAVGDRKGSVV